MQITQGRLCALERVVKHTQPHAQMSFLYINTLQGETIDYQKINE